MDREQLSRYSNKQVSIRYTGGEVQGTCISMDVYLNVAIETETEIRIIKGAQIEEIYEMPAPR